jgi:pilus assembly protein CpaB
MWKVKRMNTARIVVLTNAVGAGGVAAYLASGSDNEPAPGDVILSKRDKSGGHGGWADAVNAEVILSNIRVFAINLAPKEKDDQNTVVGKTVTLELMPEQAETLAPACQSGTLFSPALRSIVDVNVVASSTDGQALRRSDTINVVRYGVSTPTTTPK